MLWVPYLYMQESWFTMVTTCEFYENIYLNGIIKNIGLLLTELIIIYINPLLHKNLLKMERH